MGFDLGDSTHIVLPRDALLTVFNECDQVEVEETGGRVIGTYTEREGHLAIHVTGIIGPGLGARRTPTSFFQDGEEQEQVFRQIERTHPEIEHLGNWHTHHVNGLATLSGGDIATYHRTVNHPKHNTSFFYALLVVAKHHNRKSEERYAVKHYLLRRDDNRVYEVAQQGVEIVDERLVWPTTERGGAGESAPSATSAAVPTRVYDRDILGEFYKSVRPYTSPRVGVYWRGALELVDGSRVEVVAVETDSPGGVTYSLVMRKPPEGLQRIADDLAERAFPSARAALIEGERACNRALYERLGESDGKKPAQ